VVLRDITFVREAAVPGSVKKTTTCPLQHVPLFYGLLSSLVGDHGYEIDAVDSSALNQTEEEFLDYCIQSNPDIILFEPATTSINYIIRYLSAKQKNEVDYHLHRSPCNVFAKKCLRIIDILHQYYWGI
jgi:hypothetical protein